jgi:hypothetical protein
MANKKMTMTAQYEAIKALLNGETVENYSVEQAVEFIDGRIAQVAKKNAPGGERKLTKTQLENEGTKGVILEVLSNTTDPVTIADMQKLSTVLGALSNQKITALVSQLVKANAIVRTEEKGKAYFALPTEE